MQTKTEKLSQLAISGTGLVFDPVAGAISTANPVGVSIIQQLGQGRDVGQIKEALLEEYDAIPEIVERDIHDFISQLQHCGLLQ